MLKKLSISNYAIIDELEVQFEKSLNIITGETGAGKSILVGALNLVLGARADSSVLNRLDKKCVVEALFIFRENEKIRNFLLDNDLDSESELVLRREVSAAGKSRSFINDTPVNLGQLRSLSILLVDLHQQFDTLELNSDDFQLAVIDSYAANETQLKKLALYFLEYETIRKERVLLKIQQEAAQKEFDYNRFLLDELEKISLSEGELEHLEEELKLLSNAETISRQLQAVVYEMEDSESPLLVQLKSIQQRLQNLSQLVPGMEELARRISESLVELRDASQELNRIQQGIRADPQRMETIEDRVSAGFKLLRKHNATNTGDLLKIQQELSEKLLSVSNMESKMGDLEKLESLAHANALHLAEGISEKRKAQLAPFTKKVNTLLKQVGMPNAELHIELEKKELSPEGIDAIMFLFDANKSGRAEPVGKVASGGELSRLMLCIKSLVAAKLELPTLIFDEIDSGISGEAAKQVGRIMQDLATHHQLISITHQPQIAAKAVAHYFVFKETRNNRVVAGIKILNTEERVLAIAQMLGGEEPSAIALENAREMINR